MLTIVAVGLNQGHGGLIMELRVPKLSFGYGKLILEFSTIFSVGGCPNVSEDYSF
jgi:hypothetical protein